MAFAYTHKLSSALWLEVEDWMHATVFRGGIRKGWLANQSQFGLNLLACM